MTKNKLYTHDLLHLSTRNDMEKIWYPKQPESSPFNQKATSLYTEPSIERISCSPTIDQCFIAIYPNISHLFEVDNVPYLEFFVYSPVARQNLKVVSNKEIIEKRYVHDGHITSETWIVSPCRMEIIHKVRFTNLPNIKGGYYWPYGDTSGKDKLWYPTEYRHELIW